MCSHSGDAGVLDVTARNISTDQRQIVISFRPHRSCDVERVQENYKNIVGDILNRRDVIVVTKEDQLKDLISDDVNAPDRRRVTDGVVGMLKITPQPESQIKHYATLVKDLPTSVAKDLARSTEFIYGNLWFLVPYDDTGDGRNDERVIEDIRKLTPSSFRAPPELHHEAVLSPAMSDGLEILWFKPNETILLERFAHVYKNDHP